jgi:hypothetical protein
MHWMRRNASEEHGSGRSRLGLLLLLVGPNGDGFGGQAFMEHYSGITPSTQSYRDTLSKQAQASASMEGGSLGWNTLAKIVLCCCG